MGKKFRLAFSPGVSKFYLLFSVLLLSFFSQGQTVTGTVSDDNAKNFQVLLLL